MMKIILKLMRDKKPNWKGRVVFVIYHEFLHVYFNLKYKIKRLLKLHKRP